MKLKYLFGPVLSRRLGVSLGIDLIPYKTCSLDCVYCECGRTNNFTLERKEYVLTEAVINELANYLSTPRKLDYITFSGSGEPTLHSGIGRIIDYLKKNHPQYRIALLTNSTLLYKKDVRNEIKNVDLIVPSLDAVTPGVFQKINRPINHLECQEIIKGLIRLRKEFERNIWLEIFLVPGLNDSEEEIKKFRKVINKMNPDKVQLNSLDRPGTEKWVNSMSQQNLKKLALQLGDNVEIIK